MPTPPAPSASATSSFVVRVRPGAGRDGLSHDAAAGWVLRVAAPPVDGRANTHLTRFLAREVFGIAPSRVRVRRGEKSHTKQIEVDLDPVALDAALAAWRAR